MSRTISCFVCGRMLAEIPNGGKIIKEGFRAYCLPCLEKKEKAPQSSGFPEVPDFLKGMFGK